MTDNVLSKTVQGLGTTSKNKEPVKKLKNF
jgi:hypothetical protein